MEALALPLSSFMKLKKIRLQKPDEVSRCDIDHVFTSSPQLEVMVLAIDHFTEYVTPEWGGLASVLDYQDAEFRRDCKHIMPDTEDVDVEWLYW